MHDQNSLRALQERLREFRDVRDWAQFHTLKNLAAAIAVEGSELQEIFLWTRPDEERTLLEAKRELVEEELADVIIQALNFANVAGINAYDAVQHKIDLNETRYPVDRARGSARKYTEL